MPPDPGDRPRGEDVLDSGEDNQELNHWVANFEAEDEDEDSGSDDEEYHDAEGPVQVGPSRDDFGFSQAEAEENHRVFSQRVLHSRAEENYHVFLQRVNETEAGIGTEEEEDFESDEDDDFVRVQDEEEEEGDEDAVEYARAHYQMLIPFPEGEQISSDDNERITQSFTMNNSSCKVKEIPEEANESAKLQPVESSTSASDLPIKQPMDVEQVEAVKNAMQKISIPPEVIPSWAKELGEQDWQSLVEDIRNKRNSGEADSK